MKCPHCGAHWMRIDPPYARCGACSRQLAPLPPIAEAVTVEEAMEDIERSRHNRPKRPKKEREKETVPRRMRAPDSPIMPGTFGARMYDRQRQTGVNLPILAERTGFSVQYLSRLRHNKQRATGVTVEMLARGLECDAYWLMTGRGRGDSL